MDSRTDNDSRDDLQREDALMQRLFAVSGRRGAPDAAALQRAEEALRRGPAPIVQRRKRKRTLMTLSIAASVLAAVGLGLIYANQQPAVTNTESIARLVKSVGPVEVIGGTAATPNAIRSGRVLLTGATGRASLRYRGADVRLDVATTVRFDPTKLVLERGALYIDTGDTRLAGEPPVLVETRFGMLGHTGTQFMARLDTDRLTVAVREGTVFVKSGGSRRDMSAQAHAASFAEVDASGDIQVHEAAPYGGMWSWVPEVSPGFTAEGKSVDTYLGWLGREYGYAVEYDNPISESLAKSVLLHGDLSGLAVADAIVAVSATTQLAVNLDAVGVIRVSLERDHDADPRHDGQQ